MISLDAIRRELKVKPSDSQGIVIYKAQEQAKVFLRAHQPFVWNATNLTKDIRKKHISFFERYSARVRVVYLETDWHTELERNRSRKDEVPESVIERFLGKTVPPARDEAENVEWICV